MEFFFGWIESSSSLDVKKCPFLSNISDPTNFSFASASFPSPTSKSKGPIFEDAPNFGLAFKLFHGRDGVVPLPAGSERPKPVPQFNPLASKAASIGLSAFGPGGPFGFDFFNNKWKKMSKKSSNQDRLSQKEGKYPSSHEALSNEWLESGQCPIARSYRAVSNVVPLVAKSCQPLAGLKLRCPPAVVAARAALARTALVKNLRPQPLPAKALAIAALAMAANVPLGVWREHTHKFSPQWFVAVHAAVPFIAVLRKSVLMPKTAMALTIAASVLGQTIASRAERLRLKAEAEGAGRATAGDKGHIGKRRNCSEADGGSKAVVAAEPKAGFCF